MENEDQEFWRALLTNRRFRSRFIRDLELQDISSRSARDLAQRYRDEEMLSGHALPAQSSAASVSW